MRILILSNFFPPKHMGGGEWYAYRTGVELVRRGMEVDVITSRSINENSVEEEVEGMRIHRVVPRLFTNLVKRYNPFSLYCFNSLFNPLSYKMLPLVRKIRPDLFHMHAVNFFDLSTLIKSLDRPAVWTIHGYWPICPLGSLINFNKNDQLCIKNCVECIYPPSLRWASSFQLSHRTRKLGELGKRVDLLIAPSNFMREKLLDFGFTKEDKVKVIRNGVDIQDFPYTPVKPTKIILFVGKLTKEKGCEYLIKAMPEVLRYVPDAKLHVAFAEARSSRTYMQFLNSLVKELGLEKNVRFLGTVLEVSNLYQKAEVVVVPSLMFENCSLVIVEALASGRPVIASASGGNPELIESGKTGFLIEPKNYHQISERILRILLDDDLAKKMGEIAREKAEKELDMRTHIEKLEDVYQEILHNRSNFA